MKAPSAALRTTWIAAVAGLVASILVTACVVIMLSWPYVDKAPVWAFLLFMVCFIGSMFTVAVTLAYASEAFSQRRKARR